MRSHYCGTLNESLIDQTDPKIKDVVVSVSGHSVITDKFTIDKKTYTRDVEVRAGEVTQIPIDTFKVAKAK